MNLKVVFMVALVGALLLPSSVAAPAKKPVAKPKPKVEYFANCTALKRKYPRGVPKTHPAYRLKFDRDRDGWACEPWQGR